PPPMMARPMRLVGLPLTHVSRLSEMAWTQATNSPSVIQERESGANGCTRGGNGMALDQDTTRVPAARLQSFMARAFEKAGLPAEDAAGVAELMVRADLNGADGHGVFRLPSYVRRIQAGGVNTKPNIRVVEERASTALVDGDNGMGHLVMRFAAET